MRIVFLVVGLLLTCLVGHSQHYLIKSDKIAYKILLLDKSNQTLTYQYWNDSLQIKYQLPDSSVIALLPHHYTREDLTSVQKLQSKDIRAIKSSLSAWINGTFTLAYEHQLLSRWSLEPTLKVHGIIDNDDFFQGGWGAELGFRYALSDPYRLRHQQKVGNIIHGWFARPVFGYSKRVYRGFVEVARYHHYYGGLHLGKQWLISSHIVMEIYGGAHLYSGSSTIFPSGGGAPFPSRIELHEGDFYGNRNRAYALAFKIGYVF